MISQNPSSILRDAIQKQYGSQVPGCVFYVTRNGVPYADGSFGWARMPGAQDGALFMDPTSLVHTGSVGKLVCAVTVLRLIQEWNWCIDNSIELVPVKGSPTRKFKRGFGMQPADAKLVATAFKHNARIDLDTKVYPLLRPFLDSGMISRYGANYPGIRVTEITIRDLLAHTSGIDENMWAANDAAFLAEYGEPPNQVYFEPGDELPTVFNHSKITTALLKDPANPGATRSYSNAAYSILSAFVEAVTGIHFTAWCMSRLFPSDRFRDITRKPIDAARSARYYDRPANGSFTVGNHHPDYNKYSGAGGWYMSAAHFCDWVDALFQKELFNGRPILDDPNVIVSGVYGSNPEFENRWLANGTLSNPQMNFSGMLGLDCSLGIQWWLNGATKNGGAGPGGGGTNAAFAMLRAYGDTRICAFVEANVHGVDATGMLVRGLKALSLVMTNRPGPAPVAQITGLRQTAFWQEGATVRSATKVGQVSVSGSRTDLFGTGTLAGGRHRDNDITMIESTGSIKTDGAGAYRFRLTSDDGSVLWINDEIAISNDGDHPEQSRDSEPILLEGNGLYPFRVKWFNSGGGGSLFLQWQKPGAGSFTAVPASSFSPD